MSLEQTPSIAEKVVTQSIEGKYDFAESTSSDTLDKEKEVPPAPTDTPQWVSGIQLVVIMVGVSLVCLLMLLDIAIVSTAIPKITSDFHSLEDVGWYGAAYQLSTATLLPLSGKVYSNLSLKWSFLGFFLVFEFGSLICGLSVSSNMLIIGRAIAGMGGSGMQNGAIIIVAACAPMHKRPMLMGIAIGIGQLGLVGGPLIGGLLTEFASWRWCFYINLPIGGLVAVLLVFTRVPEQVPKLPTKTVLPGLYKKMDLVGFALLAPTAIMLLLAIQYGGNEYSWNSAVVIGLLCGAAALFTIWSFWNYRQKMGALIPLPLLRKQHVWSSCLVFACLSGAMFSVSYWKGVRGKSPALSGVFLLPSILSQLVAGIASGKGVGVLGYYLPFSVASGFLTAIGYGLLTTLGPGSTSGHWIGYQIIFGVGRGLGLQMGMVAIQNQLPPAQIPVAMSLLMFSSTIGGALVLSFANTIFSNSLRTRLDNVQGINPQAVIKAGAYAVRRVVSKPKLEGVLSAYSHSIDNVFYLCTGLAITCFAFSWFMGWKDIREKKDKNAAA